jgi:hypothetical protein
VTDQNASLPVAAWYPDPTNPAALRWWDGLGWTPHVTSRAQQAAAGPDPRFSDPRYFTPPAIDESRALPTLAAAAADAAAAPLPTAAPTAAPSYEPAYVPSGGYQAAYLSAHPEADLSPRPGAYQQAAQQGQTPGAPQAYPSAPAALPSDIPTQYQAAPQSPARPETEPIDYPSVMDGYPQPGQQAANDPGPMAAALHANRTPPPPAPQLGQPIPGQLDSYPPPNLAAQQPGSFTQAQQPYPPQGMPAPAPQPAAAEYTASLLSQAPPPSIAALLGSQPAQPALTAAPASPDLTRQAAAQLAAAEQLAQQGNIAEKAAAYKVAAEKAIAEKAAFESAAAKTAAAKAAAEKEAAVKEVAEKEVAAQRGAGVLPEQAPSGGFTEGYQAGFRAALEGKAQVAASEKRSREVDPNAEPVPLAGLDPANQARSRGLALDPKNDPLTAPMHRGGA